jgi:hypothetical protein
LALAAFSLPPLRRSVARVILLCAALVQLDGAREENVVFKVHVLVQVLLEV